MKKNKWGKHITIQCCTFQSIVSRKTSMITIFYLQRGGGQMWHGENYKTTWVHNSKSIGILVHVEEALQITPMLAPKKNSGAYRFERKRTCD